MVIETSAVLWDSVVIVAPQLPTIKVVKLYMQHVLHLQQILFKDNAIKKI